MGRAGKNLHRQMLAGNGKDTYNTMPDSNGGDSTVVNKPKMPVDTVGLKRRIQTTGDQLNTLMGARSEGGVNSYDKNKPLNTAIDMTMDDLKAKTDSLRTARKKKTY